MFRKYRNEILNEINIVKELIINIEKYEYEYLNYRDSIKIDLMNRINSLIKYLSKYDDKVYNLLKDIYIHITTGFSEDKHEISVCSTILMKIEEIIYTIKNKKINIVFMPYNSSMWNSMESIWKAASEDEDCNCCVVPIPYYKLISKRDGTTEEIFNYEGDRLPKDIPVIDYKEFNLAQFNADIIYVHNQYDEHNNATRVFSEYFSYNLKKNTKLLVYVTYGILGTYPISFYNSFYSFIATRKFDKVIVQSPIFKMIAEKSGISKDRLLSLGSPKFDSLVNSLNKKNIKCLNEKKIKYKIVILWVTNLMKIINGGNQVLNEIEDVFNYIRKNPQYSLIYRPHPLEFEYIKSKAPECFERYNDMLNSIKNIENISIDTEPSYYESFNISDCLISDRSSVLIEYMATGKPVLIYDIGLNKDDYSEYVFDIFSNYIVGEGGMNFKKFIKLVENKEDNRMEERKNALKTVISNSDGSCGSKIHNEVKLCHIDNSIPKVIDLYNKTNESEIELYSV